MKWYDIIFNGKLTVGLQKFQVGIYQTYYDGYWFVIHCGFIYFQWNY